MGGNEAAAKVRPSLRGFKSGREGGGGRLICQISCICRFYNFAGILNNELVFFICLDTRKLLFAVCCFWFCLCIKQVVAALSSTPTLLPPPPLLLQPHHPDNDQEDPCLSRRSPSAETQVGSAHPDLLSHAPGRCTPALPAPHPGVDQHSAHRTWAAWEATIPGKVY